MDEIDFWSNVSVGNADDCWTWSRSRTHSGHGRAWFRSQDEPPRMMHWLAHRVAWVLANGEIPDGVCVLHRCDNPPCVNPSHLFLGTKADNTHDMQAKGREYWAARSHCKNGHSFAIHGGIVTRHNGKQYRKCYVCAKASDLRAQTS